MIETPVVITDNECNTVKELVVIYNKRCPSIVEYAIKRTNGCYLMISYKQFKKIIDTAIANGFYVFDYTTFE